MEIAEWKKEIDALLSSGTGMYPCNVCKRQIVLADYYERGKI